MEKDEKDNGFFLWIDRNRKVISFEEAKGFEQLCYPTHEEMFRFAIEKGNEGYGIQ